MFHSYTYRSGSTGSTTLTTNQIPSHSHSSFDGGVPWGTDWNDTERQLTCRSAIERSWTPTTNAVGGGGSHYHSISGSSSTTGDTGSGSAVSIVQSYYTVYIWTRTF